MEKQRSAQSSFQKLNVDNSCQKTRKIRYYIFEVFSNSTVFLHFKITQNTRKVYQDLRPDIFKTKGIFRTLVYPKLWHIQNQRHIQNPGLFKTLGYSEPETYAEPCQVSMMECFEKQLTTIIIFASSNYFRNISFSCPLVHKINPFFLMSH